MGEPFSLHPILGRDGLPVDRLNACRLLLMNDRQYPWLILVPEQPGIIDWDQLTPGEAARVWEDVTRAGNLLRQLFQPDKLNIAALGNVVPQLHIHVIARFHHDPCWPRPVWGQLPPIPYHPGTARELVERMRQQLAGSLPGTP